MKNALFVFIAFINTGAFSQNITFIQDSIMDAYMKSGYSNIHFMPKGKSDKKDHKQGAWKDYEVRFILTTQTIDDAPFSNNGYFLVYGEGRYVDNKRDGKWKLYIIEDKTFKKILFEELTYVNGYSHGPFTTYYPSGKIDSKGNYLYDFHEGEVTFYKESGIRYSSYNYKTNKRHGKSIVYFDNQQIKIEKNYSNDTLEGLVNYYYTNGKLKESVTYSKGICNGINRYYHENGQLWIEKEYKKDTLWTIYSSFDEQGNPRDFGTLKNGTGTAIYYTLEGKVYLIQHFNEGVLIRKEEFEEDPF